MSIQGQIVHETAQTSVGFFYPLFFIFVALTAYYYYQQNTRKYKLANKIVGLPTLPYFGNALDVLPLKSPHEIMNYALSVHEQLNEKVIRFWIGSKLLVGIYDPHDVEIILNSNVHLKKSNDYRFFEPWLGDGLLISHGEKWRTHRKLIAPTFHINILKSFIDVFNKKSRQVVEKMRKEKNKCFDVHDYMSGTTVEILLETAMGLNKVDQDAGVGYDYAMAVMKLCEIIQVRQFKFYLRSQFLFGLTKYAEMQKKFISTIHTLTSRVVKEKKQDYLKKKQSGNTETYLEEVTKTVEKRDEQDSKQKEFNSTPEALKGIADDLDDIDKNDVGQKKRLAFLDFLIEACENGNGITDTQIKEQVDTIMFEGHDTTAAGSSFVLCMLGVHQNIQERVKEELNEIFGDSNRLCTFNDTVEMKYLERVILETLRLYPPVPVIAREVTEDVQLHTNNAVIPAGTTVIIPQFITHRTAENFPDPLVFDPDRFLPERCQNRHYYAYYPFSAGPRSCVGRKYALLKLKVLLSTIIRNFNIKSEVPEKDFKLQGDIILKRADGFRIRLEERSIAVA